MTWQGNHMLLPVLMEVYRIDKISWPAARTPSKAMDTCVSFSHPNACCPVARYMSWISSSSLWLADLESKRPSAVFLFLANARSNATTSCAFRLPGMSSATSTSALLYAQDTRPLLVDPSRTKTGKCAIGSSVKQLSQEPECSTKLASTSTALSTTILLDARWS